MVNAARFFSRRGRLIIEFVPKKGRQLKRPAGTREDIFRHSGWQGALKSPSRIPSSHDLRRPSEIPGGTCISPKRPDFA